MNNNPEFKIYGEERRKLKKELNSLKSYARRLHYFHGLDKDMASMYGTHDGFPKTDTEIDEIYANAVKEIMQIENKLKVPY